MKAARAAGARGNGGCSAYGDRIMLHLKCATAQRVEEPHSRPGLKHTRAQQRVTSPPWRPPTPWPLPWQIIYTIRPTSQAPRHPDHTKPAHAEPPAVLWRQITRQQHLQAVTCDAWLARGPASQPPGAGQERSSSSPPARRQLVLGVPAPRSSHGPLRQEEGVAFGDGACHHGAAGASWPRRVDRGCCAGCAAFRRRRQRAAPLRGRAARWQPHVRSRGPEGAAAGAASAGAAAAGRAAPTTSPPFENPVCALLGILSSSCPQPPPWAPCRRIP